MAAAQRANMQQMLHNMRHPAMAGFDHSRLELLRERLRQDNDMLRAAPELESLSSALFHGPAARYLGRGVPAAAAADGTGQPPAASRLPGLYAAPPVNPADELAGGGALAAHSGRQELLFSAGMWDRLDAERSAERSAERAAVLERMQARMAARRAAHRAAATAAGSHRAAAAPPAAPEPGAAAGGGANAAAAASGDQQGADAVAAVNQPARGAGSDEAGSPRAGRATQRVRWVPAPGYIGLASTIPRGVRTRSQQARLAADLVPTMGNDDPRFSGDVQVMPTAGAAPEPLDGLDRPMSDDSLPLSCIGALPDSRADAVGGSIGWRHTIGEGRSSAAAAAAAEGHAMEAMEVDGRQRRTAVDAHAAAMQAAADAAAELNAFGVPAARRLPGAGGQGFAWREVAPAGYQPHLPRSHVSAVGWRQQEVAPEAHQPSLPRSHVLAAGRRQQPASQPAVGAGAGAAPEAEAGEDPRSAPAEPAAAVTVAHQQSQQGRVPTHLQRNTHVSLRSFVTAVGSAAAGPANADVTGEATGDAAAGAAAPEQRRGPSAPSSPSVSFDSPPIVQGQHTGVEQQQQQEQGALRSRLPAASQRYRPPNHPLATGRPGRLPFDGRPADPDEWTSQLYRRSLAIAATRQYASSRRAAAQRLREQLDTQGVAGAAVAVVAAAPGNEHAHSRPAAAHRMREQLASQEGAAAAEVAAPAGDDDALADTAGSLGGPVASAVVAAGDGAAAHEPRRPSRYVTGLDFEQVLRRQYWQTIHAVRGSQQRLAMAAAGMEPPGVGAGAVPAAAAATADAGQAGATAEAAAVRWVPAAHAPRRRGDSAVGQQPPVPESEDRLAAAARRLNARGRRVQFREVSPDSSATEDEDDLLRGLMASYDSTPGGLDIAAATAAAAAAGADGVAAQEASEGGAATDRAVAAVVGQGMAAAPASGAADSQEPATDRNAVPGSSAFDILDHFLAAHEPAADLSDQGHALAAAAAAPAAAAAGAEAGGAAGRVATAAAAATAGAETGGSAGRAAAAAGLGVPLALPPAASADLVDEVARVTARRTVRTFRREVQQLLRQGSAPEVVDGGYISSDTDG